VYILTTDQQPTTDRPTDRPLISNISNGHISATDYPIPFMFSSMWGFRGRRI